MPRWFEELPYDGTDDERHKPFTSGFLSERSQDGSTTNERRGTQSTLSIVANYGSPVTKSQIQPAVTRV
jgi:hypothetical protein